MSFSLDRFGALRPYLYHLTSSLNEPRIRSLRRMESAGTILTADGQSQDEHRPRNASVDVDGHRVIIRDQKPLVAGNIEFEEGWDLGRLIRHLNQHVFFWPGDETGPIKYGINHFNRYKSDLEEPSSLVVLRLRTQSIIEANSDNPPRFCRYNSGAPRCSGGKKSPRGSKTFLGADVCEFTSGKVVEVVFRDEVNLPKDTEICLAGTGVWKPLFDRYHWSV